MTDPTTLLILGAGWTSTFLIPLLQTHNITYTATSRPARPKPDTIPFEFDPTLDDPEPFRGLPKAQTVLITFPIKIKGGSERLVRLYEETHKEDEGIQTRYIQLGSTGIWDVSMLQSRLFTRLRQTYHPVSPSYPDSFSLTTY